MQPVDYKKYGKIFSKTMLIGIPAIGIALTFLMHEEEYKLFTKEHYVAMLVSTITTGVFWFSCIAIVKLLWEKFPWHIKPVQHLTLEIVLITGISIGLMHLLAYGYSYSGQEISQNKFTDNVVIVVLLSLFLTSFYEGTYFYYQWKYNFNKSAQLEKENIIAQYETLKGQTNPHFLFNSLNTLLTIVENNKEANSYIQNLSGFLRYTLKDKSAEIKSVKDEINIVEKYFFLQKYRFGSSLNIKIDVQQQFYNYHLPPLSLQILGENAIKHNIISKQKPLNIHIFIQKDGYIVVENNLQQKIDVDSTNTGLENIKKRYKFLSAKNVNIKEKGGKFTVELPLLKTDF